MTWKKISVIIPAYNVEKYIRRCLDSLVNQTYENMEIIVVNDGSTDRTSEFIHEYAERFPEMVFVYDRENGGQAEARNFGLAKATGEYIGFVDSDDFVSAVMYERLYAEAEENGCDLVTCGYYGCEEESGEISVYQTGYRGMFNQSIYENPEILRRNSPYPWNKLYTRELLERTGFQFRRGMIFEDLCAVFPLFLDVKKVGRVHEKLYYYMKGRKGGTISTFDRRHGQIIDALQIMNDAYQERGEFERFYDTLLFFNIRHIYARFDEMEQYDDEEFCEEFTGRAYALLDKYFPGWRDSEEYRMLRAGEAENPEEERGDETGTDETVSEEMDLQTAAEIPDEGQTEFAAKSQGQKAASKGRKRSEIFDELVSQRKIEPNTVLIACYHGNDIRGAGYYIGEMLAEDGNYTVYMAAADTGRAEKFREQYGGKWEFLDMNGERYLEVLATAEILVANRAFPGFYRKRRGQKYIFTDFMPSLFGQGRSMTYGMKNMQGIQFCLAQADAVLFPLELKDEFIPLLKQYNMEEICCDKGVFVSVSDFFEGREVEAEKGMNEGECMIAYVPSVKEFPVLKDAKNYLFLSDLKKKLTELDGLLGEGQKILVCYPRIVRRYLKEDGWRHIEFLPGEAEPAEVLSRCQGLIGEYSEELYWMKALGKPVCRFATDEPDVMWSRGCQKIEGREFKAFHSEEEVAVWINDICKGSGNGGNTEPSGNKFSKDLLKWLAKKRKNRRTKRKIVYLPACKTKKEFDAFVGKYRLEDYLFFIEKQYMTDDVAAWIREWGEKLKFIVIIRSIVVSKKESRMIKYKLTTKEKLKEKRDRERYL